MIRRYGREAMRNIWAEENKFSIWLQIEIRARCARSGAPPTKCGEITYEH